MNQLLKIVVRRKNLLIKNAPPNLVESSTEKTLSFRSCHTKMLLPCTAYENVGSLRKNHAFNFYRTFARDSKDPDKKNYNGSSTVVLPKTLRRLVRKNKIREALEGRQRILQKGVVNVLEDRRIALTNTRKRIQEKGKLIIKDIKETKHKVKEKIEEVIEKENIYTIPNLLCVTRIGLSPFLGYLIVSQKFEYALVFVFISGVSDWVILIIFMFIICLEPIDGWIARNYNQSSKIGSFLDPMADKVLIGTLFLSLTYVNLIPVPLTALIVGRDVILIISGFVIRYKSLPSPRTISRYFDVTHATAQLAPTFVSKINTGIQLMLVGTTLAAPVFGYVNHQFLHVLWYVTATSTVISASSYIFSKETYKYFKPKKKSKYDKEINR